MNSKIKMKDKIAKTLSTADKPLHIKEIAENFSWIPESTVRGRLNDNVWKLFERVGKWLYILKGDNWTIWLINWDARKLDDKFNNNSVDLLISDHAWLDEKSHKGWSRNFASTYDCFKYETSDFKQKHKVLKNWGFLVEFLPEKNANNRKYLRKIEDMAEQSGLNYFAEVNITWGNSNIWRKKKFISSAYFFTKWESRKLKIWDEKLSKMIKEGNMKYMKKEYMVDFKKIYSEVLNIEKENKKIIESLPFIDKNVSKKDIEDAINKGKLIYWIWNNDNTRFLWDLYENDFEEAINKWIIVDLDKTHDQVKWNTANYIINPSLIENNLLREGFLKHVNSNNLPQFKKYNKILEKLQWLYHYKKNEIMTVEQQSQYDELIIEESNFYNAFNEYIEFLQWENSYKMWTKTILPEVFVWENLSKNEKRHESQKPLNTLEEIILQTSNSWETVVEQFAWSFIGAEAVINLGNEWKGWRNYIGIELDKERVLDAKKHLKEKYKDLKLLTADDFYWSCNEPEKQLIKWRGGLQQYKKLEVVKNRINDDLKNTVKISFLQWDLGNDESLTAKNFNSESNRILSIWFLWNKNMKEENRVLTVIANKDEDVFEIVNRQWRLINKSSVWGNLDESLIKLYNTFM